MSILTYKCPNCGGELVFDPATQNFHCEYCQSYFTSQDLKETVANAVKNTPVPQSEADRNGDFSDHAVAYACPSCGAQIITDDTTAATFCYYCHSPVVLSGRLDGAFKPDKVIPFAVDKTQAVERFLNWVRHKWFIPKSFFSQAQVEKVSGIYFPYWVADCSVQGWLDSRADKRRTWRSGDMEYTETKRYQVIRAGNFRFNDIVNPALRKANKKLVEGVQPFDDSKMVDFSMQYLSGFQAEKRDIAKEEITPEIQRNIEDYTRKMLRDTIGGYSRVYSESYQIKTTDIYWQYVLLPVWVLTYKSGNRVYFYAMNGQSGKVCGELPLDWKRMLALLFGVAVPLFLLLTFGGYLL